MKVKTGDSVKVMAGKDKGKLGEVIRVFPDKQQVLVKGANKYKRHVKPRAGIEGGIYEIEKPLPVSSVTLLDPETKQPTRVGYRIGSDGQKTRIAKKSQQPLDGAVKIVTQEKNKTKQTQSKPKKDSKKSNT